VSISQRRSWGNIQGRFWGQVRSHGDFSGSANATFSPEILFMIHEVLIVTVVATFNFDLCFLVFIILLRYYSLLAWKPR